MAAVHSTFAFAAMTAKTRRVNVAEKENTGKDCKNTGNVTLITLFAQVILAKIARNTKELRNEYSNC